MQMKNALVYGVLLVAAGRGERAGASIEGPKQYRKIGGRPVIAHSLKNFIDWGKAERIIVAIHPDDEAMFGEAVAGLPGTTPISSVHGGSTRQESVLLGLEALAASNVTHVLIHDAVRPFISSPLLERIAAALASGEQAVLPATPITDTLKAGSPDGYVTGTIPRANLYAAQTPQSFALAPILEAHRAAQAEGLRDFTDDAAIAEWREIPVRLIAGESDNIKLTVRRDIEMADEKLAAGREIDVRTGNGYDVHQLVPGDGVTLCGVFIAHDQKLSGHSDADVGYHALTDALLATCGAGDIGDHFPPSDPQWKGMASRVFLAHAAKIVSENGGRIMNADISLIAEAPRIGPHRQDMRKNMSEVLGIALERCSVKATTNETIGFIGRREGIAAIATATVLYGG